MQYQDGTEVRIGDFVKGIPHALSGGGNTEVYGYVVWTNEVSEGEEEYELETIAVATTQTRPADYPIPLNGVVLSGHSDRILVELQIVHGDPKEFAIVPLAMRKVSLPAKDPSGEIVFVDYAEKPSVEAKWEFSHG